MTRFRAALAGRGLVLASFALASFALVTGLVAPIGAQAAPAAPPTRNLLGEAKAAWERHPENVDSIIWYGRRVGYTGEFAQAIAIYTEGLRLYPNEARLLRHRGHRYLSVRDFPGAIADLTRAKELIAGRPDEVEPDGQPNARGIPTSTLHSNIRYHLALAYFITGDFTRAAVAWEEDAQLAPNLDHRVASTYWWVMSLGQLHQWEAVRGAIAPIRADWDIIENHSYHRLLLWIRGEIEETDILGATPTALEQQTVGNGVAHWRLARGQVQPAIAKLREVLATGPAASFGYIAAEQTATRLGLKP
jgi:tetratricopeptide (TPR) repeat protein